MCILHSATMPKAKNAASAGQVQWGTNSPQWQWSECLSSTTGPSWKLLQVPARMQVLTPVQAARMLTAAGDQWVVEPVQILVLLGAGTDPNKPELDYSELDPFLDPEELLFV